MDVVTGRGMEGDRGDVADRHIHGEGTPERAWRAWDRLESLAPLTLDQIAPPSARVVIAAPHPDDEVLGCGGLLALLARGRHDVLVVGVTDGEASHAGSLQWTPELLGRRRPVERRAGLAQLGLDAQPLALGVPDGRVTDFEEALTATLREVLRGGDVIVTPWRHDGHPDHEATGRAATRAAQATGCRCWEMPIWMWHWASLGDVRVPWHRLGRLNLDAEAHASKRSAIAAHTSQLQPVVEEQRAAVLPDWALARLLRPYEVFFESGAPA